MTRTLHVTIEAEADNADLAETFAALDAGETVGSAEPTLSIESIEAFGRVFRPVNLALLRAIADHEPESIRALARIVDRHPPEVTENVHELADVGLIEIEEDGNAMRPVIWYDDIDVDIPIRDAETDPRPA